MMGAMKAPMPKLKWMVCMKGPESNPIQLSMQSAFPPEESRAEETLDLDFKQNN